MAIFLINSSPTLRGGMDEMMIKSSTNMTSHYNIERAKFITSTQKGNITEYLL